MIIPIGHEETEVRRIPWVTIALIAICTSLFFYTQGRQREVEPRVVAAAEEARSYYLGHPYLELDARAREIVFLGMDREQRERVERVLVGTSGYLKRPARLSDLTAEQSRLEELVTTTGERIRSHPLFFLGFVRGEKGWLGVFSHMFVHAGWLHLLGNMLLLFLAGFAIEEVWGRTAFGALYVSSGLVSLFVFNLTSPGLDVPLVGASGAVSGVMGAFLIRYWFTRIRFWYGLGLLLRGTFSAPAWLILPLYFANELSSALLGDPLASAGGGVAHWAHVGGFVYGLGVAFSMRMLDVEARYIRPRIESRVTLASNPVIDQAQQLREAGRLDEAYDLLRSALGADAGNDDACIALWDVATDLCRSDEVVDGFLALVKRDVQRGELDQAVGRLREVRSRAPAAPVELVLLTRLASALAAAGRPSDAAPVVEMALERVGEPLPGPVALRLARIVSRRDETLAARVARNGLTSARLDPELRAELELLTAEDRATVNADPLDEGASPGPGAESLGARAASPDAPMLGEKLEPSGLGLTTDALDLLDGESDEDLALADPDEECRVDAGEDGAGTPLELGSTFDFSGTEDEGGAGFLSPAEPDPKPED